MSLPSPPPTFMTNWLFLNSKKDQNENCHKSLAKFQTLNYANTSKYPCLFCPKVTATCQVTSSATKRSHTQCQ